MRVVYLMLIVACLSIPSAAAGTAEDPEVADPLGDVAAEAVPLPAGAEWADLVSVWFELEGDTVWMRSEVAGAPTGGFYGEVASFLRIDDAFYHAGWTTVLPPAATEPYQGGFVCPSDEDGSLDPATCDSLSGALHSGTRFSVPLSQGGFGWAPGSELHILSSYSDVWYLDVQVLLDVTGEGRVFGIPADVAPADGPAPGPVPGEDAPRPTAAQPSDDEAPRGPVRESPALGIPVLVVLGALAVVLRLKDVRRSC